MHGSHIHYLSDSLMIITLVQPAKLPAHVGLFRDTKVDIAVVLRVASGLTYPFSEARSVLHS